MLGILESLRVLQKQPVPPTDDQGARRSAPGWRNVTPAVALVLAALGARLAWLAVTNYTFEDAFITFQFARRLAEGLGFVYNPGEPIYGTTTPLFALLLAGWLKVFPGAVVAGARVFGLLSCAGGLAFTWGALREAGVASRPRICALALLAASDKLWRFDTGGMETPLLFCLMMAALYAQLRGWPVRAGVAAGLLLWTRVDSALWLAALVLAYLRERRRLPLGFVASSALTYAPWLVFASLRFGSVVPHTVTAKWVHYQMGIATSLSRSAGELFAWISPFGAWEIPAFWQIALAGATLLLAAWGARKASEKPGLSALWIFGLLEATRIVLVGATFEQRYFVPVLSTTLVLAGLGLAALLGRLADALHAPGLWAAAAAAACAAAVFFAARGAPRFRESQSLGHERSLKAIGRWIDSHAPREASVLLEPLGYAGYFANRRMIDEVGLVSPQVLRLARQNFSRDSILFSRLLLSEIRPDYFVVHCDDAPRVFSGASGPVLGDRYSRKAVINPANFDPGEPLASDPSAWGHCYEIWARSLPLASP